MRVRSGHFLKTILNSQPDFGRSIEPINVATAAPLLNWPVSGMPMDLMFGGCLSAFKRKSLVCDGLQKRSQPIVSATSDEKLS